LLSTAGITLQFGEKPLFENVSVKFGGGNRYGLIGANGSGKSTFMRILGGELESSGGNVSLDAHERIGKLKQDQFAYEDVRVLDVVMMGHVEMWRAKEERDAIYDNPDASEVDYLHAAELETKFAEYGGYTAEARAAQLLIGVGIPGDQHEGPMSAVAPGWKLRVLLAQALFSDPDVLLLDEPTNNLDIATIRWLEGVLNDRSSTMVIISHDRHFLNAVCTHMADLDYGQIRVYPGSYDDYMLASTQARAQLVAANAKAKERVTELQEFVRRFSANKSKARQATSRQKMIEKIDIADIKPSSRQYPYIRFDIDEKAMPRRLAVEVKGLRKTYDHTIFSGVDLAIEAGEKVAIIGPNGIGKTTLLMCLAGNLAPDAGTVTWAEKATLGLCMQEHTADFADDMPLTEWMGQWKGAHHDDQIVRATLGRLLFSGDETKKSVKVISGGEERRMIFGKLTLQQPNVMLMDEPTNHLDMESIESLNTALEKYKGTLIFVSHDREFVSSLATRIIDMQPATLTGKRNESSARIIDFRGPYEEYLRSQGVDE
jgi:ATPase subunit of ABC transporter with duplicated ATPase domains